MTVDLIKFHRLPVQLANGSWMGRSIEPDLYGAKQGDVIAIGKTASEAINNCLKKIYE